MPGPVDLIRVDRLAKVYDPWWVLNLEPQEITADLEPQVEHMPYDERDLSYDLRRVRHFQLMAEQGRPVDPITLDNVCDHGQIHPEVLVDDGHHRLCGAILAKVEHIPASYSGRLDVLAYLTGKTQQLPEA